MIDRLHRAGYVDRRPNPDDRRGVLVVLRPDTPRDQVLPAIFGPLGEDMAELAAQFTPDELAAIGRYLAETTDILQEHTASVGALLYDSPIESGPGVESPDCPTSRRVTVGRDQRARRDPALQARDVGQREARQVDRVADLADQRPRRRPGPALGGGVADVARLGLAAGVGRDPPARQRAIPSRSGGNGVHGKRKAPGQSTAAGVPGGSTSFHGTVTGRRGTVKPWVTGVSAPLTSRIAVCVGGEAGVEAQVPGAGRVDRGRRRELGRVLVERARGSRR